MVVTTTNTGYIKRVNLNTYRAQHRGGKGRAGMSTRDEDTVTNLFVACTHSPLLFFSTRGIVYKMKTYRLPEGSPQSLGKALNLKGETVNVGQTPVKSLGVTDQHSQVQLYAEGPFDKVITFIAVDKFRSSFEIPQGLPEFPDVNFLCGNDMGKLLNTERIATEYALTKKQKANRKTCHENLEMRFCDIFFYFLMCYF